MSANILEFRAGLALFDRLPHAVFRPLASQNRQLHGNQFSQAVMGRRCGFPRRQSMLRQAFAATQVSRCSFMEPLHIPQRFHRPMLLSLTLA